MFIPSGRMQLDRKICLMQKFPKRTRLARLLQSPLTTVCRRQNNRFDIINYNYYINLNMAAVSSCDDSSENTANSEPVFDDLLKELHLDFCAQDFTNYMRVDVTPQV